MRELSEHNVMMFDVREEWLKREKGILSKTGLHADITCKKCGKELFYTGVRKHLVGPFWEYEVECDGHGRMGVKCVQYDNIWFVDFDDPPREYKLSTADYNLIEKRLKVFLKWVKRKQPDGASAREVDTDINDEFRLYVTSNGVLICSIDGRRLFLSKWTKDKIKRIFKKAGGKIADSWNDSAGCTMSIKLDGNIKALDQFDNFYGKGCQRIGTYLVDGEKIVHDHDSVFCDCDWLLDAHKKAKFPEGWE